MYFAHRHIGRDITPIRRFPDEEGTEILEPWWRSRPRPTRSEDSPMRRGLKFLFANICRIWRVETIRRFPDEEGTEM